MAELVITGAEVGGRLVEVLVSDGAIAEIGVRVDAPGGSTRLDGAGGALLPGLHDHHVHLLAAAAALESVALGPPHVVDRDQLALALEAASRRTPWGAWVRGVGYHESVAGRIDRHDLDALLADRPLRVQHRSGAEWILNTAALDLLALEGVTHEGIERERNGAPTGRLFRMDAWLGERIGRSTPDLAEVGRAAARAGVTGFTDATPARGPDDLAPLADPGSGLRQRITVMTAPGADVECPAPLSLGPVKVLLDDVALLALDELSAIVAAAHGRGRAVAVHCVTRVQSVLAVSALEAAGPRPGDRIEHGSVIPAELIGTLCSLGTTVVTNPGFVEARGDRYALEVEAEDREDLYRCASLERGGVGVAAGTDAPFGPPDPWVAIRAAVGRTTASGVPLGPAERLAPMAALSLFLGSAADPLMPRRVAVGAPADLCLLGLPLEAALRSPSSEHVAVTLVGGEVVSDNR